MKLVKLILLFVITSTTFSKIQANNDTLKIHDRLYLVKLTENAWIHVSYLTKYPCNGLLLVENGKGFLFDTPSYDSVTTQLVNYIQQEMKIKLTGFVTNDWHIDSQGGLGVINKLGIPSYSFEKTREIAKSKGLPYTTKGFRDSLKIKFENKNIELFYPGEAHTLDNIVAWIPEDKILVASCMVKETSQNNLGFTGDGNVKAYPKTLKNVIKKFPDAQYVIPGHGQHGGMELVRHTLKVAERIATK